MKSKHILFIFLALLFVPALGMVNWVSRIITPQSTLAQHAKTVVDAHKIIKHDYESPIPEDIKKILDEHDDDLQNNGYVNIFNWLPGWWVKPYNQKVNRIAGAIRYARIINNNGLGVLQIPKKYFYLSPSGQKFVISEHTEAHNDQRLNLEAALHLYVFLRKSKLNDCHNNNIIKTNGYFVFIIDTEDHTDQKMNAKSRVSTLLLTDKAREFIQSLPS